MVLTLYDSASCSYGFAMLTLNNKCYNIFKCFRTRQLWNSKADVGTPDFLAPKASSATTTVSTHKNQLPNGNASTPTEIVRADEQVRVDKLDITVDKISLYF